MNNYSQLHHLPTYRNIDALEKIGDLTLGLLRIGFGRKIEVAIFKNNQTAIFHQKSYSTIQKTGAVALALLTFPATLLFVQVGFVACALSTSYQEIEENHNKSFEAQNLSATIIQKNFKRFHARKNFLTKPQFSTYKTEVLNVLNGANTARASHGFTQVFLPPNLPIILKMTGVQCARSRFQQMVEMRSIINSEGLKHLVIPRAALCGDFLVEERLPIKPDQFNNLRLYFSEPELFNEAVCELVKLFSRTFVGDLLGEEEKYFLVPPRFDNMPLYIENSGGIRVGKIGLIDLGESSSVNKYPVDDGLKVLLRFFPLHAELIEKETKKLNILFDVEKFQKSKEQGLHFLYTGPIKHEFFLKAKNIDRQLVHPAFTFDLSSKEKLIKVLQKSLLRINQGQIDRVTNKYDLKDYSRKNPDYFKGSKDVLKGDLPKICRELASQIIPLIIEEINLAANNLGSKRTQEINKRTYLPHEDISELLKIRTFQISPESFHSISACITSFVKINNPGSHFNHSIEIQEQLVIDVLEQLVKDQAICSFEYCWYDTINICY